MYQPALVLADTGAVLLADLLLDEERRLVWAVCPSLPAPKLRLADDAGRLLRTARVSTSRAPECPSALVAFELATDTGVLPRFVTVLNTNTEVCLQDRLAPLRARLGGLPANAVVLTTLFKDDRALVGSYRAYYRAKGIQEFLMYDNAEEEDPGTQDAAVIPWPLPYWAPDKPPGTHHAQSTHLLHAALLCWLYAPHDTWLFNFDLDEVMECPLTLPQLVEAAQVGGCDVVGVRSVWADRDDENGGAIRTSPFHFEWGTRSKYGQRIRPASDALEALHRGIHTPAAGGFCKLLLLDPRAHEGHLLHFAFLSGAERSAHIVFTT